MAAGVGRRSKLENFEAGTVRSTTGPDAVKCEETGRLKRAQAEVDRRAH